MSMPDQPPPRRRATALHYTRGEVAPTVTATGAGLLAERIVAAAREAGVPVREDPALVEALAALISAPMSPRRYGAPWPRRWPGPIGWTRPRRAVAADA